MEGQLILKSTCLEIKIDSLISSEVRSCVLTYLEVREKKKNGREIQQCFLSLDSYFVFSRLWKLVGTILSAM